MGKDRWHLYRTAEGSAAEVHAQLRIAEALGQLPMDQIAASLQLADKLTAMCFGLTRDKLKGG